MLLIRFSPLQANSTRYFHVASTYLCKMSLSDALFPRCLIRRRAISMLLRQSTRYFHVISPVDALFPRCLKSKTYRGFKRGRPSGPSLENGAKNDGARFPPAGFLLPVTPLRGAKSTPCQWRKPGACRRVIRPLRGLLGRQRRKPNPRPCRKPLRLVAIPVRNVPDELPMIS